MVARASGEGGVGMAEVSPDNKLIARHAVGALGGKPRVVAHWDEPEEHSVDIAICENATSRGLTSYSTVNLSDTPLMHKGREYPVRIELVGACKGKVEKFANVLSTAAFFVMKEKWFCRPGVVFETLVGMYKLSKTLEHLYFTAPSQWPELNKTLKLKTKKVTWLWAIPISEAESRYIAEHGDEKFESLLEESDADVFDIRRKSIV
jgi:hypothetical protein